MWRDLNNRVFRSQRSDVTWCFTVRFNQKVQTTVLTAAKHNLSSPCSTLGIIKSNILFLSWSSVFCFYTVKIQLVWFVCFAYLMSGLLHSLVGMQLSSSPLTTITLSVEMLLRQRGRYDRLFLWRKRVSNFSNLQTHTHTHWNVSTAADRQNANEAQCERIRDDCFLSDN